MRKLYKYILCLLLLAGCNFPGVKPTVRLSSVTPDGRTPVPAGADTVVPRPVHASDTPIPLLIKASNTPAQTMREATLAVDATRQGTEQFISETVTPTEAQPPQVQTPVTTTQTAYPVQGAVLLQDGMCCVGGVVGSQTQVRVAFSAQSPLGPVAAMRFRTAGLCLAEADMAQAEWQPFTPAMTLPLQISAINWVGYWISVQYRDSQGNLSPVYCDDISVEGMPAPPEHTP